MARSPKTIDASVTPEVTVTEAAVEALPEALPEAPAESVVVNIVAPEVEEPVLSEQTLREIEGGRAALAAQANRA